MKEPSIILTLESVYPNQQSITPEVLIAPGLEEVYLMELVSINNQLRGQNHIYGDTTFKSQLEILRQYVSKYPSLYSELKRLIDPFLKESKDVVIFSRSTCLVGIEYVLCNRTVKELPENNFFNSLEQVRMFVQYCLSINSILTFEHKDIQPMAQKIGFKALIPTIAPLNIYFLPSYSILTFGFFARLLKRIEESANLGSSFTQYIRDSYGVPLSSFLGSMWKLIFGKILHGDERQKKLDPVYSPEEEFNNLFESLIGQSQSPDPMLLKNIRRFPFIKFKLQNGEPCYLLTDHTLLIERMGFQLLQDFQESYGDQKIKYEALKAEIGLQVERMVSDLLKVFYNKPFIEVRTLKECFYRWENQKVEAFDFYVRYSGNIIIGEVKTANLNASRFVSGTLNRFYDRGFDKFFDKRGIEQLARSIGRVEMILSDIDPNALSKNKLRIVPVIVTTDPTLQLPLILEQFQIRFKDLLDYNSKKIFVDNLQILSVEDCYRFFDLGQPTKPIHSFKILRKRGSKSSSNLPFYQVLDNLGYKKYSLYLRKQMERQNWFQ